VTELQASEKKSPLRQKKQNSGEQMGSNSLSLGQEAKLWQLGQIFGVAVNFAEFFKYIPTFNFVEVLKTVKSISKQLHTYISRQCFVLSVSTLTVHIWLNF